jgi:hypothetical protein
MVLLVFSWVLYNISEWCSSVKAHFSFVFWRVLFWFSVAGAIAIMVVQQLLEKWELIQKRTVKEKKPQHAIACGGSFLGVHNLQRAVISFGFRLLKGTLSWVK